MKKFIVLSLILFCFSFRLFADAMDKDDFKGYSMEENMYKYDPENPKNADNRKTMDKGKDDFKNSLNGIVQKDSQGNVKETFSDKIITPIDNTFKIIWGFIENLFPTTGFVFKGTYENKINYNNINASYTKAGFYNPLEYSNYNILGEEKNGLERSLNNNDLDEENYKVDLKSSKDLNYKGNITGVFKILFCLCFVFVCFYCAFKCIKGLVNSKGGFQASMIVFLAWRMFICILAFLLLPFLPVVLINIAKYFCKMITGIPFKESMCLSIALNFSTLVSLLMAWGVLTAASVISLTFLGIGTILTSFGFLSLPFIFSLFFCFITGVVQAINLYVWQTELFIGLIAIVFLLPFTLFDLSENASPIGIKLINILKFYLFNFVEICVGFVLVGILYKMQKAGIFTYLTKSSGIISQLLMYVVPAFLLTLLLPSVSKILQGLIGGNLSDTNAVSQELVKQFAAGSILGKAMSSDGLKEGVSKLANSGLENLTSGVNRIKDNFNSLKELGITSKDLGVKGSFNTAVRSFKNGIKENRDLKNFRQESAKQKEAVNRAKDLEEMKNLKSQNSTAVSP